MQPHVARLPERRFCVRRHLGPTELVDHTRRAMYQHMVSEELVGGPSALRILGPDQRTEPEHTLDVLIGATCNFDGDDVVRVEVLPEGDYAVLDYEGPEDGVDAALERLRAWVEAGDRRAVGAPLAVHIMDPIDGVLEQQLQLPLAPAG